MFTLNDDLSIYATRGDIVFFSVTAEENGKPYKFQPGEVVRIKVYGKKDAENVVLEKDFPVTNETESVEIFLDRPDTKIGDVISKPTDYWYSVTLNDDTHPQTLIGYDEDGAKVFKLFPEGADVPPYEPTKPEDIPLVDAELDLTSSRPVENRAIARAVVQLNAELDDTKMEFDERLSDTNDKVADVEADVVVERARIDNLVAGTTPSGAEVTDIRIGADGVTYGSAGTAVREQVGELSREIHDVLFEGMLNPKTFTDNIALGSDGVPTTTSETIGNSTCKIPVKKGTCVSVIGEHISRLCLYTLSDEVIPESYIGNDTPGKTTTVHQDGYLRFTIVTKNGHALYQPKEAVKVRVTKVNRNNLITPRAFGSQYLYEPSYNIGLTANYIVAAGGIINNNGNYYLTDFIPVEPMDVLSISHSVPYSGAFYDENKNWVKAIQSSADGVEPLTVKVPYNAVYARFNIKKDIANNYSVVYGEEAQETPGSGIVSPWFMRTASVSKWEGATFCTLGDSITWQDGKAYGQGDVGAIARGYQTVIKEKLHTASYDNYGVSGAPVANGSKNGEGTVAKAKTVDYANYDLCIIAGGTNDFKLDVPIGEIGNIGDKSFNDTTFFGAYRKMVEHILTEKPTIRICLFTPLHRNNGGYNISTTNKAGHKLIEYVNAIKAIGEMYSLPVCDVYSNSGINSLNLSVYTMDGLHPNDKGYERMGEYCAAFLETI